MTKVRVEPNALPEASYSRANIPGEPAPSRPFQATRKYPSLLMDRLTAWQPVPSGSASSSAVRGWPAESNSRTYACCTAPAVPRQATAKSPASSADNITSDGFVSAEASANSGPGLTRLSSSRSSSRSRSTGADDGDSAGRTGNCVANGPGEEGPRDIITTPRARTSTAQTLLGDCAPSVRVGHGNTTDLFCTTHRRGVNISSGRARFPCRANLALAFSRCFSYASSCESIWHGCHGQPIQTEVPT